MTDATLDAMSESEFGDATLDDAWDDDPTVDPLQVAIRLHLLRRYFDVLAGGDGGTDGRVDWEDLSSRDRDDALATGELVVIAVAHREPDDPAAVAQQVHEGRQLEIPGLPDWDELTEPEREIGVTLMALIIHWLELEGPR